MSSPTRPVPDKQVQAFGQAVCARLGLDPAMVGEDVHWEVDGEQDLAPVRLTVYLPAQEVLDMFNGAAELVRQDTVDRSRGRD